MKIKLDEAQAATLLAGCVWEDVPGPRVSDRSGRSEKRTMFDEQIVTRTNVWGRGFDHESYSIEDEFEQVVEFCLRHRIKAWPCDSIPLSQEERDLFFAAI